MSLRRNIKNYPPTEKHLPIPCKQSKSTASKPDETKHVYGPRQEEDEEKGKMTSTINFFPRGAVL